MTLQTQTWDHALIGMSQCFFEDHGDDPGVEYVKVHRVGYR